MADNMDIDVLSRIPEVTISLDQRNVSILCRMIEPGPFGASGKSIRLSMTAADAMRSFEICSTAT